MPPRPDMNVQRETVADRRAAAANTTRAPSKARVVRGPWGASDHPYPTIDSTARAQAHARTTTGRLDQAANTSHALGINHVVVERTTARRLHQGAYTVRQPGPNKATVTYGPVRPGAVAVKRVKKKPPTQAEKAGARLRASAVNGWVISAMSFWYLAFQLPMAVLSIVGLMVAAAVYEKLATFTQSDGILSGMLNKAIGPETFFSITQAIIDIAAFLYGIEFNPLLLFVVGYGVVFLLGLLMLGFCWFCYSMSGVRSLSGQHAGAKVAAFLLAWLGVGIPILNLFPLFLVWQVVVWLNPR